MLFSKKLVACAFVFIDFLLGVWMSNLLKIVVIIVTAKIVTVSVKFLWLYHIKSLPLLCFVTEDGSVGYAYS